MARRAFLTDAERQDLLGVPTAREELARHYILSTHDIGLVEARRGDANRIGFAVQLALLRHPGFGFSIETGAPSHLVAFVGDQIGVAASAFAGYAARPATASLHAREAEAALGLRPPTRADLPIILKAGTLTAWSTDRAVPIVNGIVAALQRSCLTLPAAAVIERVGLASSPRPVVAPMMYCLPPFLPKFARVSTLSLLPIPTQGLRRLRGYARSALRQARTTCAAYSTG
jgi:hypothetical protein